MKMKHLHLFVAMLFSIPALAQSPYIALQGAFDGPNGLVVNMPRTVLSVDLTVEQEVTLCGPYARYAQKYLGVRAPLVDKTVWRVSDARISLAEGQVYSSEAPAPSRSEVVRHAESEREFARLQPDKVSMTVPSLEDAARSAAEQIYALRRHRLELIKGEAGENVFGGGLDAALCEIARLEQSYLELFLGKQVVNVRTLRSYVFPEPGKTEYLLGRFSTATGILPDSDLSGDMILLQLTPSGDATCGIEADAKESSVVECRVAVPAVCTVLVSGEVLGRTVLPIFEFGRTVRVAVPRRK